MFPIRDHNPSGRVPYVNYALILINIGIFCLYSLLIRDENQLSWFFVDWGLVPQEVMAGQHLYGIVTSMFLHAGFMHLAGNMLFLWIFGDNLEDLLGPVRYAGFYLLGGMAAGAMQIAAGPESPVPMIGASGAIAAVMGGYLLLFPRAKVDVLLIIVIFFRVFAVPAWVVLGIWFALQLFSGVSTPGEGDGVAYWAHAGGFIAGVAMIFPVWLGLGGASFWNQNEGKPPHPEATYTLGRSSIPRVARRK
ncbi:rhomboid family intramembrane serine protease [Pseudorhodobacter sp.]|uniref:rhomboid family intramembrane serine protease n=1 Tax=Pseudorhodobacter sp. TaxID=1934400 RepID=UPI0026488F79|nr:rhomboid family intramembrane serine protease [Pseudorhodobacter sp.]MDN5786412.1 rhomboid family intramembrane serine protease [Pseudorhodobacter sp.]